MILKKYLTEVSFVDGSAEFKSYRNYTRTVLITREVSGEDSVRITLDEKEIDLESLSIEIKDQYDIPVYWRKVNGASANTVEAYLTTGNLFLEGNVVVINYIGLNEAVSDLYSVDYENGILYLAAETNIDLTIDYKFYNVMLKGKKATQLDDEDYQVTNADASINNYKSDSKYKLVYNVLQKTDKEYTTPVINNIKVNYVNTSEDETF